MHTNEDDTSDVMMPPMLNLHKIAHLDDCHGDASTDRRMSYAPCRMLATLSSYEEESVVTKMKERMKRDDEDSTTETKSRKGSLRNVKKRKNVRKSKKDTNDEGYTTETKSKIRLTKTKTKKNVKKIMISMFDSDDDDISMSVQAVHQNVRRRKKGRTR